MHVIREYDIVLREHLPTDAYSLGDNDLLDISHGLLESLAVLVFNSIEPHPLVMLFVLELVESEHDICLHVSNQNSYILEPKKAGKGALECFDQLHLGPGCANLSCKFHC